MQEDKQRQPEQRRTKGQEAKQEHKSRAKKKKNEGKHAAILLSA